MLKHLMMVWLSATIGAGVLFCLLVVVQQLQFRSRPRANPAPASVAVAPASQQEQLDEQDSTEMPRHRSQATTRALVHSPAGPAPSADSAPPAQTAAENVT